MALYELYSENGDEGMIVGGAGIDRFFRAEADEIGKTDERLLTISDPEALLQPDALRVAARGLRNRMPSLTDPDQ